MSAIPAKRDYVEARITDSELAAEVAAQLQRIMAGQNVVLSTDQMGGVDDMGEIDEEQKR